MRWRSWTPNAGISVGVDSGAPSCLPSALIRASAMLVEEPVAQPRVDGPVLVTVRNVPIVEVGIEYKLSTGPKTFTVEDLIDAASAANEDFSIKKPRLKLGHVDPRYNDSNIYDGTPSFGKATNLRFDYSDLTLYGDFVGVPKWLADIMPVAFPNRSIEAFPNVEAISGKTYQMVITAVALLGVVWPGVSTLDDLPDLAKMYGSTMPENVQIYAGGGQMGLIAAAANLDDVRRQFYNTFATAANGRGWWWIRAIMVDPNQLVAEDDETGDLYRIPFEAKSDDEVEFGDPTLVRMEYVDKAPDKVAAKSAAVAGMTALAASSALFSRAEAPPHIQGGQMDPKLIRQALNLPEDATDEQVKAAMLSAASGDIQPAPPHDPSGTTTPQTRVGVPEVQQVSTGDHGNDVVAPPIPPTAQVVPPTATVAPVPEPVSASTGVVMIDAAQLHELQEGARQGALARQQQVTADRNSYLDAAQAAGKFPASRREHYAALLAADEQGTRQLIDGLAHGLVPVLPIGHGQNPEGGEQFAATQGEPYPSAWFPEIAARKGAIIQRGGVPPQVHIEMPNQAGVVI